jgi:shikimate kinase
LEKRKLSEVLYLDGQIIATGGGTIVDEENLRLLQEKSLLICLTAPPETLMRRSASGQARPLLQGEDRASKIEALLNRRESVYARAHLVIDTGDLSIDGVVDKILEQIRITEGTVRIGRS